MSKMLLLGVPATPSNSGISSNSLLCSLDPRLKGNQHKAQIFLSFLSVKGGRHDSVFSVGFRVPFGIGGALEVKGRMATLALSAPLAHQVPGAGARLAPLAAGAKNNPAAVVGQGRVTGRACQTGASGFSGCHQRAVITSGLIISGHV